MLTSRSPTLQHWEVDKSAFWERRTYWTAYQTVGRSATLGRRTGLPSPRSRQLGERQRTQEYNDLSYVRSIQHALQV